MVKVSLTSRTSRTSRTSKTSKISKIKAAKANTTRKKKLTLNNINKSQVPAQVVAVEQHHKTELYQKPFTEEQLTNWKSLIQQRTNVSPGEELHDCTYNSLLFMKDIDLENAKSGSKNQNCSKANVQGDDFLKVFKKSNNDKTVSYKLLRICIQDLVTSLRKEHACYMLFERIGGDGHAVLLARDKNDNYLIIDPQHSIKDTDLFQYIHIQQISNVFTITKTPIKYKVLQPTQHIKITSKKKSKSMSSSNKKSPQTNIKPKTNAENVVNNNVNKPSSSPPRQTLMLNS